MKKRIVSSILIGAPILLLVALSWMVGTESGLNWLFHRIAARLPGELSVEQLTGRLIGPLTARGLRYESEEFGISSQLTTLDWSPAALLSGEYKITALTLRDGDITLPAPRSGQTGDFTIRLPKITFPFSISIDSMEMDNFRLTRPAGIMTTLEHARLQAAARDAVITITTAEIAGPNYMLNLQGTLSTDEPFDHDLQAGWQYKPEQYPVIVGTTQLKGDLHSTRLQQKISGLVHATFDGTLLDLEQHPRWQGELSVSEWDSRKIFPKGPDIRGDLATHVQGDFSSFSAMGNFNTTVPLVGRNLGSFDIAWQSGRLDIKRLNLIMPATDTRVLLQGNWQPGADYGQARLSAQWQNLPWPLQGTPVFLSDNGRLDVTGTLKNYALNIDTTLSANTIPTLRWTATGNGNGTSVDLNPIVITMLGGEITGNARLGWRPEFFWTANLQGKALNPAQSWPAWNGNINFVLDSQGRHTAQGLQGELNIPEFGGVLREYPLRGVARINVLDKGIRIDRFTLESQQSRYTLQGDVAEQIALSWKLLTPDLSQLFPDSQGALLASGTVSGWRDAPAVTLKLEGGDLRYRDHGIAMLRADLTAELFNWQHLRGKLTATDAKINNHPVDLIELAISGTDTQHQIGFKLRSAFSDADIAGTGSFLDNHWQGIFHQADIDSDHLASWRLISPVNINAGADTFVMDPACWQSGDATTCAQIKQQSSQWMGSVDIKTLPLAIIANFIPYELFLDGKADFSLLAGYTPGEALLADARLTLGPGTVTYPQRDGANGFYEGIPFQGDQASWDFQSGNMELHLDAQGLRSQLDMTINPTDQIQAEAALSGYHPFMLEPQHQPLTARANVMIHDLRIVESLVPEIQDLQGEMNANLTVSGTLASPEVLTNAKITSAGFRIPRLGISISEFTAIATSSDPEHINYRLSARSGDGTLLATGQTLLERKQGWLTQFQIAGENFEISRIPEAHLSVSPTLQGRIKGREIDIDGEIFIPYARLEPKDISRTVRVSEDTEIIGQALATPTPWRINSTIRLVLGDRVTFYGYGFEGRIGGDLVISDKTHEATVATGELNTPDGRYRVYGQRLDIQNGRIIYANSPLDNPGLDIRAVRTVGDIQAGIQLQGTLRHPRTELYSLPAMSQSDALAYLVLGHPLERTTSSEEGQLMAQAALALSLQGGDYLARSLGDRFGFEEMRIETSDTGEQASLVIGRYLSPRLYISYGVGLIEAVNTINMRYQLSRRWQLKAESGIDQKADLLYSIEH